MDAAFILVNNLAVALGAYLGNLSAFRRRRIAIGVFLNRCLGMRVVATGAYRRIGVALSCQLGVSVIHGLFDLIGMALLAGVFIL